MRAMSISEGPAELVDGAFRFSVAGPRDRHEINRVLAENPMAGRISVSLEHAPDPLKADFGLSPNHVAILARRGEDPRAMKRCRTRSCRCRRVRATGAGRVG